MLNYAKLATYIDRIGQAIVLHARIVFKCSIITAEWWVTA